VDRRPHGCGARPKENGFGTRTPGAVVRLLVVAGAAGGASTGHGVGGLLMEMSRGRSRAPVVEEPGAPLRAGC